MPASIAGSRLHELVLEVEKPGFRQSQASQAESIHVSPSTNLFIPCSRKWPLDPPRHAYQRLLSSAFSRGNLKNLRVAAAVGAERSGQAGHTDRTAWAHYACLKTTSLAACPTPCRFQGGRSYVYARLYTVSHRCTYPTTLLVAEVDRCLRSADVQICVCVCVSYRGPGQCLVTGVLLWLVRGSGTVYRLHCVTLKVFTDSESCWRGICLVATVAHSDYVFFLLRGVQILSLTYLLTYLYWIYTQTLHRRKL